MGSSLPDAKTSGTEQMSETTYPSITPYLTVRGAASAIEFYREAFGAEERSRMPAQDGERLIHAELVVNGGLVFLSDEFPEFGGCGAPDASTPVAISLALRASADVDALHARALAAGAKPEMGPMDAFWGARFASLRDPFGHRWMLNAPL